MNFSTKLTQLFFLGVGPGKYVQDATGYTLRHIETKPDAYRCNAMRYKKYNDLEQDEKTGATDLAYEQDSWNEFTNDLEQLSWSSLILEDAGYENTAAGLGWDEDSWDCRVNHFEDYWWFEIIDEGLQIFCEMLGWDETSWDSNHILNCDSELGPVDSLCPQSETKMWAELTDDEKLASEVLCWFEDLWDETSLASNEFTITDANCL